MGLFAVKYQDVPGRGVIAQGGLKFRATEESLSHYFSSILPFVSLNDLIGEAVFWIIMPSTITLWIFPILIYKQGLPLSLLWIVLLHVALYIIHLFIYVKPLNYLVFVLANPFVEFSFYIITGIYFVYLGHISWAIAMGSVFIFYKVGLDVVLISALTFPINRFVGLPTSDALIKLIGWHYGRKYTNEDPTEWKMSNHDK